jgi:hypothetical protein
VVECLLKTHTGKTAGKHSARLVSIAGGLTPSIEIQPELVVRKIPLSCSH